MIKSEAWIHKCVCVKGEPISHNFMKPYIYINKSFAIIPVFVLSDMHLIFYFWGALFGLPKLFLSTYLFRAWTQDIIHRSLMSYGGILILRMNFSVYLKVVPC